MQDERKIIKVVTSGVPNLYPDVAVYDSTLSKIQDKHPEEFTRIDEVYQTIENPDSVYQSKTNPRSVTLVNNSCTSKGGDPLRVAIKVVSQQEAILSTAHFSSSTDQGQILWSAKYKDE